MYKAPKARVIAAAVLAGMLGISSVQAGEPVSAEVDQVIKSVNADNKVSKSEARKIIKEYLKSKDAFKKLKVGQVQKYRNNWKVDITSLNKIRVLAAYVDDKTGEITFKQ